MHIRTSTYTHTDPHLIYPMQCTNADVDVTLPIINDS